MELKTTSQKVVPLAVSLVTTTSLFVAGSGLSYLGKNGNGDKMYRGALLGFGFLLKGMGVASILPLTQNVCGAFQKYSFTEEDFDNDVTEMSKEELDKYYFESHGE